MTKYYLYIYRKTLAPTNNYETPIEIQLCGSVQNQQKVLEMLSMRAPSTTASARPSSDPSNADQDTTSSVHVPAVRNNS